ncbi:MAG: N-acetylmuramoyl-L-alanine amidase [Burkholderiales bacterium]
MTLARASLMLAVLALAACSTPLSLPQRTALPVEARPSGNFDERRPNYVILHYTSNDSAEPALRTLRDPASKVSAHYLIARDGRIYALVDERTRAWHAGVSSWGGDQDINSASIGIELDNSGKEPFAAPLLERLFALLADLKARYSIPAANFIGHSDVAPRRKVDPGVQFPWRELAARGFGLWCDPPYRVPPAAEGATLLAAFGYDTSNEAGAIGAFKLHFVPDGDPRELTDGDRALLACLIDKKRTPE